MPNICISLKKEFPKLLAIASQLPTELPVFFDGKMTTQAVLGADDTSVWLWMEEEVYHRYVEGNLKIVAGYDVVQAHSVSKVPKKIRFNALYLEDSEHSANGKSGK